MTTLRPTLQEIYAPIEKELQGFSGLLRKELVSQDALIRDIHEHLLKMSGKFLRPALAIFCAKLNGRRENPNVLKLAVAIELIHTATLVHDDIIDDSELRRNQPSVYSKWGREISIVSGDYLYAKAFMLLASLQEVWVNQAFAACAHVICEGEMKQIEKRTDFLIAEEDYFKIIGQKTASLFQAACMGGAYYAGFGASQIETLGHFGYELGMAFQIIDDCLDLTSETENLGKTAGLDLQKSDPTLPLLYLFQSLSAAERESLIEAFKKSDPSSLLGNVRKWVIEWQCIEKATEKARSYIEISLQRLSSFPNSIYKESLSQLAAHCLERAR